MIGPLGGIVRFVRGIERVLHWRTPVLLKSVGVSGTTASSIGASLGRTRRVRFEVIARPAAPDAVAGRVEIVQRSTEGEVLTSARAEIGTSSKVHLALADADGSSIEIPSTDATGAVLVWEAPTLVRRRAFGELMRITRGALAQYGWRGLPRRLALAPGPGDGRSYLAWVDRHNPDTATLAEWRELALAWSDPPIFSILTPVHDTDPQALRECWQSVRAQVYPHWQWCLCDDGSARPETLQVLQELVNCDDSRVRITRLPVSRHISVATNTALTLATGAYVAFLDHDDTLAPEALWAMARHVRAHPADDLVYSDEDKLDEAGQRCEPAFKPDWSPDLLRAWMYPCHLTVIRRSLLDDLGGMRIGFEGAQDYDLWLRASERTKAIGHVPEVLYHWRKSSTSTASSTFIKPEGLARSRRALEEHLERKGVIGRVEPGARPGLWRVRLALRDRPLVTVVLPTDGGRLRDGGAGNLLLDCLDGLIGRTAYRPLEIIVAHNGVLPPGVDRLLATVPHHIVHTPAGREFNFPRKLNHAAAYARGAYLLLLNDDIVVQHADWLEAMLEIAQDPEVGVVGPRLRYPDGRLQHVGLLLGVCGIAAHAYHGAPADTDGYLSSVLTVRNYSAVTGACLLTPRALFERLGGFDESFPIDFNDVDYCLRVRRLGLRVVYTPHAELVHHESSTIGPRTQAGPEGDSFRERWAQVLGSDPYYSPNLTRHSPDWGFGEKL